MIAIVPAHESQPVIPAHDLTHAAKGCGYDAASYDPEGIVAIKVCGQPAGIFYNYNRAYLVQLNAKRRVVRQLPLAPRSDGASLSVSRTGAILISEYQAPEYARPPTSGPAPPPLVASQVDIWTYVHQHLRLRHVYKNNGYSIVSSW